VSEPEKELRLEDVNDCQKCHVTGTVIDSRAIPGGTLVTLGCDNERCRWYKTHWIVELDGDGKVKVNKEAMAKTQRARNMQAKSDPQFEDMYNRVHQSLARQQQEELRGGPTS
jgi:hypothetical protein